MAAVKRPGKRKRAKSVKRVASTPTSSPAKKKRGASKTLTASKKLAASKKPATPKKPAASKKKLTTAELAARLGVHPSTVLRRQRAGTLVAAEKPSARITKKPGKKKARALPSKSAKTSQRKASTRKPTVAEKKRKKKLLGQKKHKPVVASKARPARKKVNLGRRGETIRSVETSSSPTLIEAAPRFGVTPDQLYGLVLDGKIHGLIDGSGVLRIPALELQLRTYAGRERRRKKRARTQRAIEREERKKRGKQPRKARKKRAKRKRQTRAQRFAEALADDLRPSGLGTNIFGPTLASELPDMPDRITRDEPMPMRLAAEFVGVRMRDFVLARTLDDRLETGSIFHDSKVSFKKAYGVRKWKQVYAWIVEDWGLDDYIFEYEALRDS